MTKTRTPAHLPPPLTDNLPIAVVLVLVVAPQGRHGSQADGVGEEDLGAGVNPDLVGMGDKRRNERQE